MAGNLLNKNTNTKVRFFKYLKCNKIVKEYVTNNCTQ